MLIHHAQWVVTDPWTVLEDAWVSEKAGRIISIDQRKPVAEGPLFDHGPGFALIPGLVNAHTHLELSALKGRVSTTGNFIDWVRSVVLLRAQEVQDNLERAAQAALSGIEKTATALVAEISTLGFTRKLFKKSRISGIWFQEFLGSGFVTEPQIAIHGLKRYCLAGHGPHTTTPATLVELKNTAMRAKSIFSVHLAESIQEDAFIRTNSGEWAGFLRERGMDTSQWDDHGESPVTHCARLGILDENTLAVHLVFADRSDLEIIANKKVPVCLCPRSNMALHKRLPDVLGMRMLGIRPCLGTDSLACVDSLDIMDEMAFMAAAFPGIPPSEILAMATVNGAESLGFPPGFGRITPGSPAIMRVVPVCSKKAGSVIEAVVSAGGSE